MARSLSFFLCIAVLLLFASSCISTQRTTYFNDAGDTTFATRQDDIVDVPILKNDILSVTISSANAEASALFNTSNNYQTTATTSAGTTTSVSGYLVNNDGYIQLPILGSVKAAGLTRKQLKTDITNLI